MPPLFVISDTDDFTASDLSDIIQGAVPAAVVVHVPRIADHVFHPDDLDRLACVLLECGAATSLLAQTLADLRARGVRLIWIGHKLPADGCGEESDLLLETPFTNETVQRRLTGFVG